MSLMISLEGVYLDHYPEDNILSSIENYFCPQIYTNFLLIIIMYYLSID